MIIPTAEPFFFPGGPNGCLLVHGFTGSPKEMRWMGEYLAGKGHSVLGIRLAGHATQADDMLRTRWQDWATSVEDGYHILKCSTERIFLMGLSMGGVLSLLQASRLPVTGVVAMSTPYKLPDDPRLPYIRPLSLFQRSVEKGPSDWQNPDAALDHVDYPYYPTRAIAELRDLLVEMRLALPRIRVPVLLIHSKKDGSVVTESMPAIYERLGSTDKQMLWIQNSGHVITREPERRRVFQAVHGFIERTG